MAQKARSEQRNVVMGNYRRGYILVALHCYGAFSNNRKSMVVDRVRRDYSVLGWTFYARRAAANCLSNGA